MYFLWSLRPSNGRGYAEDSEEEMDEDFVTHSPEPPELVLPEERTQTNESSQSGRLHPEQQLPHTFKVGAKRLVIPRDAGSDSV